MNAATRIAVIGAGLMGHGIAQVFASAGKDVRVYDPSAEARKNLKSRIAANLADLGDDPAALDHVEAVADLRSCVETADFVVEAALEDLAFKQALFAELEGYAKPDAILASNTSVIPITRIMAGLHHKQRALGTHWWNPPFLVPLVEVIATEWTAPKVIERTLALHKEIGKTPVHVKRDVPGSVGNRLQHALWREAIALVQNGICDAETVDTVVKASFGRRLGVLGPLENADLVGTDLTLAIHNTVLPDIDATPGALPFLENLVAEGHLGMKTGQGFRHWTEESKTSLRRRVFDQLRKTRDEP
jgi:3-hydroxybutyryl-CoA dehydrogenase